MSHLQVQPEPILLRLTNKILNQQQPALESSPSSSSTKRLLDSNTNTCLDSKPHPPHSHSRSGSASSSYKKQQTKPCCWFHFKFKFKFKGRSFTTTPPLMAGQADLSLHHVPINAARSVRTKKPDGQHRKEQLESEVSVLLKMLDNEEKVNKILEHTISRPDGSAVHIPSFLPPKVKELLAELAMVEDEITRLEAEIVHVQNDLSQEQQTFKESKIKLSQHKNLSNSHDQFSVSSNPKPAFQGVNERVPFETKALYFISKAIKGDYTTFPLASNEKNNGDSGEIIKQKENYWHGEIKVQEKISKKSGTQKPSSPNLPPRNSTSKPMEPEVEELSTKISPKSTSNLSPKEEKNSKLQPNKLSESIMKCLIFIFVRLLRTSRAIELEKSGTISRSTHASLSSRSFRVESSVTNLGLQKDLKQQDPYDIFNTEESIPRDIGPYKNLVRFTSTSLDPKSISGSNSSPLLQKLRVLMSNLQSIDLKLLTQNQKLAFWINMYNACIMHGFILYGVPSSQESLFALMNRATLTIGGSKLNAVEIENFILRKPSSSSSCNLKDVYWKNEEYAKESFVRDLYGLDFLEPNITFALCCGTRSSPAVRIYTANGVSAELEKSKLDYLQAAIIVTKTKRLIFPELLLQNMFDFGRDMDSLVDWVCQQLPTSWSLRKSMVECFRAHNTKKLSTIVDKMPYDFEFQYLLFV